MLFETHLGFSRRLSASGDNNRRPRQAVTEELDRLPLSMQLFGPAFCDPRTILCSKSTRDSKGTEGMDVGSGEADCQIHNVHLLTAAYLDSIESRAMGSFFVACSSFLLATTIYVLTTIATFETLFRAHSYFRNTDEVLFSTTYYGMRTLQSTKISRQTVQWQFFFPARLGNTGVVC